MSTDDEFDKNKPADTSEDINNIGTINEASDTGGLSVYSPPDQATSFSPLRAVSGDLWAQIWLSHEWSDDGRRFTVRTEKYQTVAAASGRGRLFLQLDSGGEGPWELVTDNAYQNGTEWRVDRTYSINSNASNAAINFSFRWNGDKPNLTAKRQVDFYPAVTPSIDPIRNVNSRTVRITGKRLVIGAGTVFVRTSISSTHYQATGDGGDTWKVDAPLSADGRHMTFVAYQRVENRLSPESPSSQAFLVYITAPDANAVLAKGDIFRGVGAPGSKVRVVKADNHSFQLAPEATVGTDDSWHSSLNVDLSGDTVSVVAIYDLTGFPRVVSEPVSYRVLSAPAITGPAANSVQDRTFTVTGNKGSSGAIVQVFRDTQDEMLGQTNTLTGASWSCSVTAPVGNISLAALQVVSGKPPSDRSTPRAFRIRPPKLTAVTVTTPTDTSVKFEGSGHTGATVQITVVSGPNVTAPAPAPVNGGSWNTTATNWPFGSYSLQAIQRFPDGDNGWIDSQPYTFPVTLILPAPTDVTYTPVYQPVFSGKGFNGATVMLFNPGLGSKAAPDADVSSGQWQSTASEVWGPTFKQEVHIKQQYLDGVASSTWIVLEVNIPPLAPVMNVPVENGLSPDLNGTCWPGAVLTLTFSDSTTEHPVENNNGTWHFRRT
ncbi:hypothetical protein MA884_10760, partial [Pseudomonas sp. Q11]|nr:hypothetical protein [Pseudomonas sp. Q11]